MTAHFSASPRAFCEATWHVSREQHTRVPRTPTRVSYDVLRCVCVRVRVRVRVRRDLHVCVRVRARVCVCV